MEEGCGGDNGEQHKRSGATAQEASNQQAGEEG